MLNNIACRLYPFRGCIIVSFSLHERFGSLLRRFVIETVSDSNKDLRFDNEL